MKHVDYPHEPGTLYDCPPCERECYCYQLGSDIVCLHCSLKFLVELGWAIND